MQKMETKTKIYILSVVCLGAYLLFQDLILLDYTETWITGLVLIIIASLAYIYKVEGTTAASHYNISFLVYSFTIFYLGLPWALAVMLISSLVDWIRHKYPWYIQTFNIGAYAITFHLTSLVIDYVDEGFFDFDFNTGLAILAGITTYVFVNHLLVGFVIWFARGETFTESGIFDFLPMMIDATLLGLGGVAALLWNSVPITIPLLIAPLYLIQHTLRVPALERGVVQDPKTKLFNAEYLMSAIDKELERANRFDRPMTIVIGDMDLLRNVNNNYGHVAGDIVLMTIANILNDNVRESDVVARYGGEEFVILMPETRPEDAYNRVEEIRELIANAKIEVSSSVSPLNVTMSFGIAQREGFGQTKDEIIHNADLALYHSKLKGRNRTFIYSKESFDQFYKTKDAGGVKTGPLVMDSPAGSQMVMSMREHQELDQLEKERKKNQNGQKEKTGRKKDKEDKTPLIVASKEPPPAWYSDVFIGLLFTVSLMLMAFLGGFNISPTDWIGLIMFSVIVFLTEYMSIEIYVRETSVSTSAAPLLAGVLLFGPMGALVLSLTLAVTAWFRHHGPISRVVFNFSNQVFASFFILLFFKLTGVHYSEYAQAIQLFISLIGAIVVYGITTLLISFGIWSSRGMSVREVWRSQFQWLATYYLVFGALAYALTFGFLSFDVVGVLFIVTPLFLLRISQKQYIDHTKKSVDTLRKQNFELQRQADEISQLNEELLNVFAYLLDMRDPFVLGHSQQVAHYCVSIGRELGLPEQRIENLRKAAILHDIGKLAISDSILLKPGRLNPEEMDEIRNHVNLGGNLINQCPSIKHLAPIVSNHHEQYGGGGYPQGLKEKEIPIESRILCLADSVEAMSSDRPYRAALTYQEIIDEINRCKGTQFDPDVVDAFLLLVDRFGPGYLVNSAAFVQNNFKVPSPMF